MTRKISLLLSIFVFFAYSDISAQSDSDLKIKAKPKDMWEIGIHVGHTALTGDVDWNSSFGAGLHLRKALDYTWSVRLDVQYKDVAGLEEEDRREVDAARYGFSRNWLPEYSTTFIGGDVNIVGSLNQLKLFKKNKINPYFFLGLGLVALDVQAIEGGTEFDVVDGINFDDQWDLSPYMDGGFGIGFLVSNKVSISLEHKISRVLGRGADLMDAVEFQGTLGDRVITKDDDLLNYTNVRLGINLGKAEDKALPLWWASPLDLLAEDLAEVKARPMLDLTDTDKDGIIDMLDQEKDTPEGCPVDTRGIKLDSDGDGVADCDDDEDFSPPGYPVDAKGIAQVPAEVILSENDVNGLIDARLSDWKPPYSGPTRTDWFLPMIHFGLDKYAIRTSEFGKLHNVAEVMRLNPGIRVVAQGHTDKLAGNCYNDVLSYNRAQAAIDYLVGKYGIARDRFVLNWGGEGTNLVPASGGNLMNRRVEFKVVTTESEMGKPDCGVRNAGSGGTKYSGNKEAGY